MDTPLTKRERRVAYRPGDDALDYASSTVAYPLDQCHHQHWERQRLLPRFSLALKKADYRYRKGQWLAQQIVDRKPIAAKIVACRVFDNHDNLIWSFASTPSFLRVWKQDNAPFYAVFTPRKKDKLAAKTDGKRSKATVSLESLQHAHEQHMDRILGKTYVDAQRRPGYPWEAIESARSEAEELGLMDIASLFDAMLENGITLKQAAKENKDLAKKARAFWQERMAS